MQISKCHLISLALIGGILFLTILNKSQLFILSLKTKAPHIAT